VDVEGYGGLKLDASSRPLLRGEATVHLRREARPVRASRRSSSHTRVTAEDFDIADQALWEALRACRRRLADAQGVPPYVIFHDATLSEMVQLAPTTLEQMAAISGVGVAKLERYGDEFLAVIRLHRDV